MKELYLNIFGETDELGVFEAPLETLVVLFGFRFSDNPQQISIFFRQIPKKDTPFSVNLSGFNYEIIPQLPMPATLCQLPVVIYTEDSTCIAGICAVIRQIFKTADPMHPLLGFKQSCLYACAEASIWTKFCEVDAINTTKNIPSGKLDRILQDLSRFEAHMAQPVRAHNIQKMKREVKLLVDNELCHTFAEGPSVSIADVILFSCFHVLIEAFPKQLDSILPLTTRWHRAMMEIDEIQKAMTIFGPIQFTPSDELGNFIPIDSPVPQQCLYKSDPKRYKPRHKIFTKQYDVEASLDKVKSFDLDIIVKEPFGSDVAFDWETVPWDAQPAGGDLPEKRANRKGQQLEGMARAVLKIARNGDTIVDFCAGSGHLGLILAHFLPRCTIILLENKEESLNRARERARKLKLNNILFCQSNVDYFQKEFTIGVSLHACGVATDLVMETCIQRNAVFVCCPCCYGSVQTNHMVTYPRSEHLKKLLISEREYLVLGHAADQVHDAANAKTEQGLLCMDIIDGDRCFHAQDCGYTVKLTKLYPITCTPKNNLLIGLPLNRS